MKIVLFAGFITLMAAEGPQTFRAAFEPEVQSLGAGKSPKFFARRAHGLMMIKTVPGKSGADLVFQSSSDLGESFAETMRVNDVAGEVNDHGENSPQLLTSPDEATLYAVWNGRDPKNPEATAIRFSKAGSMRISWSPAVTGNDDGKGVSQSFQTAALAPDGTIHIAWLDGRDGRGATDGGKTWSKICAWGPMFVRAAGRLGGL